MNKQKTATRIRAILKSAGFTAARYTACGFALRRNSADARGHIPGYRIYPRTDHLVLFFEPNTRPLMGRKYLQDVLKTCNDFADKYLTLLAANGIQTERQEFRIIIKG